MGIDNWALFKLPSDEEHDIQRCELCQLMISAYVTGVEQLLQLSLYLDRHARFGKDDKFEEIEGKIEARETEVAKAWANYLTHRSQDHV